MKIQGGPKFVRPKDSETWCAVQDELKGTWTVKRDVTPSSGPETVAESVGDEETARLLASAPELSRRVEELLGVINSALCMLVEGPEALGSWRSAGQEATKILAETIVGRK